MRGFYVIMWARRERVNPQTAGVPYTEQNHLHGQRQEFRIWNYAQKTKENFVKTILFKSGLLNADKLPFCRSISEREREREKKKKIRIGQKPFYSQVNDIEW